MVSFPTFTRIKITEEIDSFIDILNVMGKSWKCSNTLYYAIIIIKCDFCSKISFNSVKEHQKLILTNNAGFKICRYTIIYTKNYSSNFVSKYHRLSIIYYRV